YRSGGAVGDVPDDERLDRVAVLTAASEHIRVMTLVARKAARLVGVLDRIGRRSVHLIRNARAAVERSAITEAPIDRRVGDYAHRLTRERDRQRLPSRSRTEPEPRRRARQAGAQRARVDVAGCEFSTARE